MYPLQKVFIYTERGRTRAGLPWSLCDGRCGDDRMGSITLLLFPPRWPFKPIKVHLVNFEKDSQIGPGQPAIVLHGEETGRVRGQNGFLLIDPSLCD